jgi:hemerythrin superfamily protein
MAPPLLGRSGAWRRSDEMEEFMPLGIGGGHSKQTRTKARAGKQQNAIELLKSDHQEVTQLFQQYEKSDGSAKKADIVEKICKALKVHSEIEEDIFYPAARGALEEEDEEVMDEAEVEHSSIKSLIEQLEDGHPGDELFDAKVKVLFEYVKHHVKEEEGEMFPKVKKTDLDLDELGSELAARKAELTAQD